MPVSQGTEQGKERVERDGGGNEKCSAYILNKWPAYSRVEF